MPNSIITNAVNNCMIEAFPNIEILNGEPQFGGYANNNDILYIYDNDRGMVDITSEHFRKITGMWWGEYLEVIDPE